MVVVVVVIGTAGGVLVSWLLLGIARAMPWDLHLPSIVTGPAGGERAIADPELPRAAAKPVMAEEPPGADAPYRDEAEDVEMQVRERLYGAHVRRH